MRKSVKHGNSNLINLVDDDNKQEKILQVNIENITT